MRFRQQTRAQSCRANRVSFMENRFAPRFSFAYSVDPKTVIRSGYGVFFLPFIGAASGWASGVSGYLSYTPMVASLDGLHPADLLSNPFPKALQPPTAPSNAFARSRWARWCRPGARRR